MINDFSLFSDNATEGQIGAGYWYHEDTQSYFDEVDCDKMIKAMCRLSCSIFDRSADEQGNSGLRRRDKFKNIEQLKSHLYHTRRILMCNLCLEGQKLIIRSHKGPDAREKRPGLSRFQMGYTIDHGVESEKTNAYYNLKM